MNEARLFEILSKTFKEIKHIKVISKSQKRSIIKIVMSDDSKYLMDYLISDDGKRVCNCYRYIGHMRMDYDK